MAPTLSGRRDQRNTTRRLRAARRARLRLRRRLQPRPRPQLLEPRLLLPREARPPVRRSRPPRDRGRARARASVVRAQARGRAPTRNGGATSVAAARARFLAPLPPVGGRAPVVRPPTLPRAHSPARSAPPAPGRRRSAPRR